MHGWTIADWLDAYRNGAKPEQLLPQLLSSLTAADPAWIALATPKVLQAQLNQLAQKLAAANGDSSQLALYGVPFAVKDNIDALGFATTAACPAFAYQPSCNAFLIDRLVAAGAILLGKTNLDQFATGLVGVRSPYGIVANAFDANYIAGGSSSGSASVVARGIVPFALGTDTAGSGRVPAGLNNIVGLKPTRGAFSTRGVVPACQTLDCVSVFATTVADAVLIYDLGLAFDPIDVMSRQAPAAAPQPLSHQPRFAIPAAPEFFGDALAQQAFANAVAHIKAMGANCVPVDFSLFDQVAALLYDGPWVAQRYAAIRNFASQHEQDLHPIVRQIIFKAHDFSAADAFAGVCQLAGYKRQADALLAQFDALLVPTAPTHYRISEVLAEPVQRNSNLGRYTNFVNLLDWSAIAVPAGLRPDGLPFGITLIGAAWQEKALANYARRFHQSTGLSRGATGLPLISEPASSDQGAASQTSQQMIRLAVVGAHLRGMPLHHELLSRQARFIKTTTTADNYRLYALAHTAPAKPGLVRTATGAPIMVELWDMPAAAFGSLVDAVAAPLAIGKIKLADGSWVSGFVCEPCAIADACDITAFGSWPSYLERQRQNGSATDS